MKLTKMLLIAALALSAGTAVFSSSAHAGKVDDVKKAVKDKCGKELTGADITDAVIKAYDCQPQSDVSVADCTIKCMKSNSGSVVGDK